MNETITFRIGGKVMSTIEGSELYYDAVKYDGGSQGAQDAYVALNATGATRMGKGWSYLVTTTRAGAETIEGYCRVVGETFASETEAETRYEGVCLLEVADRIRGKLS